MNTMMPSRTRRNRQSRMAAILAAAARLILRGGDYQTLTQATIAKEAQISPGLLTYHFSDMDQLRIELMKAAIAGALPVANLKILAQGLSVGNQLALKAPKTARANAAAQLNTQ